MSVPLSWGGIVRLGLVQTALGAIVVLTTSTINRVMVVEYALPATLPGVLVGLHYAMQMLRPRFGHGSDVGGRRTPWIIGGMVVLALGGIGAALSVALLPEQLALGVAVAAVAFLLVGLGVGAAGTSLLALLAARAAPERRAAAASIVWIMMIAGFVITTASAGRFLDPFSPERLILVTAVVSGLAVLLATLAVWGMEPPTLPSAAGPAREKPDFRAALAAVWAEPEARLFTIFVFVSMLAYSAQDLILEPFAGAVFGMTLGETTQLSAMQHAGVLAGMLLVALLGSSRLGRRPGALKATILAGCLAAAAAMLGLAMAAEIGGAWPLRSSYFALGVADGAFAAAAIATMMHLAGAGETGRAGLRMGLWGAAQAIAFGLGGLGGTVALDLGRWLIGPGSTAYAAVFVLDAALFLASAGMASRLGATPATQAAVAPPHPQPSH